MGYWTRPAGISRRNLLRVKTRPSSSWSMFHLRYSDRNDGAPSLKQSTIPSKNHKNQRRKPQAKKKTGRRGPPRSSTAANTNLSFISTLALNGPDPIPPRMRCSLRYCQNFTLGSSATAHTYGTSVDLRLNSLFDPTSSSPHQPFYFDNLKVFYNRYRVRSVRITIVAVPLASQWFEFTTLVITPGVSATIGGATTDVVLEKPLVQTVKVHLGGELEAARMAWNLPMTVATGLTAQQLQAEDDVYSALVTAAPARIPLLQIACANLSDSTAQNMRCTVEVVFDCDFWERLVPAQS